MFTRFEQVHIDPQYIANMETATEYFVSWFQHGHGFNKMLMTMHQLASAGGYTGYTRSDGPQVEVTAAVAGQFRGNLWRPVLKPEWFTGVRIQNGYIRPVLKATALRDNHYLTVLPGGRGYELHLPHESFVLMFLDAMANAMAALKQRFCAAVLANYIQYFVVGHPFEKINFSICMAQVNAILRLHGYKPIYHEYLDFECFVYDYTSIVQIFISKIKRR